MRLGWKILHLLLVCGSAIMAGTGWMLIEYSVGEKPWAKTHRGVLDEDAITFAQIILTLGLFMTIGAIPIRRKSIISWIVCTILLLSEAIGLAALASYPTYPMQ